MSVFGERDDAFELAGVAEFPLRRGEPESVGDRWSAPDWLVRELGPDADAFLRAISVPGPVFLRANTLVTARDALRGSLLAEGIETELTTFARDGLRVLTHRPNLYGSPSRGSFEVQDEGSQLLGELVDAKPGDRVLDYCAGAGGKTLQLACHVGPNGVVSAWDIDRARLERLRVRAEKARATKVRVLLAPPSEQFDRVLVDAPCSELGALRRGPDLRWRLDPNTFATFPPRQLELLESAVNRVKPGGRLVYATCTTRREENEDVAREFEARHPELERAPIREGFADGGYFRSLPQLHDTDGFFAAVYVARR
ncbi:MAG: RsmB/NOP family class I SAM-dependent RNA methyltransferase [Myxococcaceae bacterium]